MNRRVLTCLALMILGFHVASYAAMGVQDFIESLRDDDEASAQTAESMLVKVGSEAVRPLQQSLEDPNFKVRRRAAETLGRIGPGAKRAAPDLVRRLLDPQFEVQEAAGKALQQMGDESIPALTEALRSKHDGLRKVALDALSRSGPKGVPIIITLLKKDENTFIRANAADALGSVQPATTEIIQALVRALSDLEESVRGSAADSLGRLGMASREAIRPLFNASREDKDALARKKASDALFQIASSTKETSVAVAEEFGTLMTQSDPAVRLEAIHGLENVGAAGLPFLIQALSDTDNAVSIEAGNAIVACGQEALPALEPLKQSTIPFLKRRANELIRRIGAPTSQRKKHRE